MFQTLFQISFYAALLFVSISYGRKPLIEDDEEVIRELKAVSPGGRFFQLRRTAYQRSFEHKRVMKELEEIKCGPYPEVVQVERNVSGLKKTPQFVRVNRCKGACGLSLVLQKCTPTVSGTRMRHVKVFSEDGTEHVEDVEEHVECTCTCQVTCNKNHILDPQECKCNCKDECASGEMQNPGTCECRLIGGRNEVIEY